MKYLIQTCLKAPRLLGFHVSESAFGNLISEGGVLYTMNIGFNIIMIGNYFAIGSLFGTLFSKLISIQNVLLYKSCHYQNKLLI